MGGKGRVSEWVERVIVYVDRVCSTIVFVRVHYSDRVVHQLQSLPVADNHMA